MPPCACRVAPAPGFAEAPVQSSLIYVLTHCLDKRPVRTRQITAACPYCSTAIRHGDNRGMIDGVIREFTVANAESGG